MHEASQSMPTSESSQPHVDSSAPWRGVGLAFALGGLVADQASKQWALSALDEGRQISVVGDFLVFVLTFNPGAAFSAGTQLTPAISAFAIVASIFVCVMLFRSRSRSWSIVLGLLLAGIVGNLADRLFRSPGPMRGHVVDFIALPNWPVFNVADIWINIGGAAAVLLVLLGYRLDGSREASATKGAPPVERPDE